MSYVLQIWDHPVPATFCQAQEIVSELSHAPKAPDRNPKFIEAAKRLTDKYPFNEDPAVEAEHEVWSDGSLTPRSGESLWGVGVLSQYAKEVQPFVVSVSNQLGLVVYDMQVGKAYLPNGSVLKPQAGQQSCSTQKKPWWKVW